MQAFLAVNEVMEEENSDFIPLKADDPSRIVLLSLGVEEQGIKRFLLQRQIINMLPHLLVDALEAARDIVEYHLETVFGSLQSRSSFYLRIDVCLHLVVSKFKLLL